MSEDEIIDGGLGLARAGDYINNIWPIGSSGLVTDKATKNKPKANHELCPPRAARLTSSCILQSCLGMNVHELVYRVLHVICTFTTLKLNVLSYLCVQLACTPVHVCVDMYLKAFICLCTCLSVFVFHFNRTEQVYRFFQQWCPNIHNATDEESDDDITSSGCCAPDEEVNIADSAPWLYCMLL